jgi:hypothetical protein
LFGRKGENPSNPNIEATIAVGDILRSSCPKLIDRRAKMQDATGTVIPFVYANPDNPMISSISSVIEDVRGIIVLFQNALKRELAAHQARADRLPISDDVTLLCAATDAVLSAHEAKLNEASRHLLRATRSRRNNRTDRYTK